MHRGYKVVACIPAGRERQMSCLLKHLRAQACRGIIDGVQLWRNTGKASDLEFIESQADDLVEIVPVDPFEDRRKPLQLNTGRFYLNCRRHDTIYIRFDDDIVYIHEDAITNLVDARIDYPEYWIVLAGIWNNAVMSHYWQKAGHMTLIRGEVQPYCMDRVGWEDERFARTIHDSLIERIKQDTVPEVFLDQVIPLVTEDKQPLRMSVSCFAWRGKDFDETGFAVDCYREEEEIFLTEQWVKKRGLVNAACGNSVVSHYSFMRQRPFLDRTDILQKYARIADDTYHDQYYGLLERLGKIEEGELEPYTVEPWWLRKEQSCSDGAFLEP